MDFPAADQMVGYFLLANSMTDLSTTVLRGDTQMPVTAPAKISAHSRLLFCWIPVPFYEDITIQHF